MTKKRDFDWNSDAVVVPEQPAIAIYRNAANGIVIRKERGEMEEDDTWIVLATVGAAYRVIDAIKAELDDIKAEKNGG